MRAQLGLGPPPEKEAAPAGTNHRGQIGELLRSEKVDETDPLGKVTEIDAFVARLWPLLPPDARDRARAVRLAPNDPLHELLGRVVRCSDGLVFSDHARRRSRGRS
jgi:hypothetical protein